MQKMEDRLAGTAVIAYLGALLMGQSWRIWEGSERTAVLLFVFPVPDYLGVVILTLTSVLSVQSSTPHLALRVYQSRGSCFEVGVMANR